MWFWESPDLHFEINYTRNNPLYKPQYAYRINNLGIYGTLTKFDFGNHRI